MLDETAWLWVHLQRTRVGLLGGYGAPLPLARACPVCLRFPPRRTSPSLKLFWACRVTAINRAPEVQDMAIISESINRRPDRCAADTCCSPFILECRHENTASALIQPS